MAHDGWMTMAMRMTVDEFVGNDVGNRSSAERIAFKLALDFEASVFFELEKRHMTRKDLAERMGVSAPAVTKMLSKGSNLTLKSIAKIAAALGCEVTAAKLRDPRLADQTTLTRETTDSLTCADARYCYEYVHLAGAAEVTAEVPERLTSKNGKGVDLRASVMRRVAA